MGQFKERVKKLCEREGDGNDLIEKNLNYNGLSQLNLSGSFQTDPNPCQP